MLYTVKFRKRNNHTWAERYFFSLDNATKIMQEYLNNKQLAFVIYPQS